MRILLVEDDELLGDGIYTGLKKDGYAVDWLKDGTSADQALKVETFDLVVLDLGLPKMDGLDVLRRLRNRGVVTPVIILTARESVDDRVAGLDSGADDYMTKPFAFEELIARIRARQRGYTNRSDNKIVYADIVLDPAGHTVVKAGEELPIARREFALLELLLANVGKVVSKDQIRQSLYSWDDDIDSNALEVHIHNLRKKFGSDFIKTIRGVGYIIRSEESA